MPPISYQPGMFERSHMHYEVDRADDTAGEPSLTEMVEKAINILDKSEEGYYLYVECMTQITYIISRN